MTKHGSGYPEWQAGERQADAEITTGRLTFYESTDEFLMALEGEKQKERIMGQSRPDYDEHATFLAGEAREDNRDPRETWGDILAADVDAVVNPVNTVGVMGAGLAKQFKAAYRAMLDDYVTACRRGEMLLGSVRVYQTGSASPRFIISFPTKKHWNQPSHREFIRSGLLSLRRTIERLGITSIAVPALGCGLGGLDWPKVRELIYQQLGDLEGVEVVVYAPSSNAKPSR